MVAVEVSDIPLAGPVLQFFGAAADLEAVSVVALVGEEAVVAALAVSVAEVSVEAVLAETGKNRARQFTQTFSKNRDKKNPFYKLNCKRDFLN